VPWNDEGAEEIPSAGINKGKNADKLPAKHTILIWSAVPGKPDDWTIQTLGVEVFLSDSALGSQSWMKGEEINNLEECALSRGDSLSSLRW